MNTEWQDGQHTICIDFNGVLDTYTGFTGGMYPPRQGALEFLKVLKGLGLSIVILTSCNVIDVYKWLEETGMSSYVSGVTDRKIPAIIYLDDRGITFNGNFDDALRDILKFKAHWEDDEHIETPNIVQEKLNEILSKL